MPLPPRTAIAALLVATGLAAGCSHVPLSSLPALSRIDLKTTRFADLRAGVSLPEEIRPLPGGVTMTVTVQPRQGGRHERSYALEQVSDPAELAALPSVTRPGRRFTVFRLSATDAANLTAFREEHMLNPDGSGNPGSLALNARKICRTGDLGGRPIPMSTYLKTSETRDYVTLTSDIDLREAIKETGGAPDLASLLPACDAPAALSGSRAVP
ncbi:hypothetical protein [Bosea sp. BK604]|uniref:hypothetical protein n=1 Tax=Bosea sp. BK604 TaxID=2512180 RepID=UPI001053FA50|nr:hypothetical protein [Bosea sp. BK604]TCR63391.1 hypothetical protein EV560_10838 [Bosea sp. BK604]